MDYTHTVITKIYSQEFTDHLNSVDGDIKRTTEGEVYLKAQSEGSTMVGEEETPVRVDCWARPRSEVSCPFPMPRKKRLC